MKKTATGLTLAAALSLTAFAAAPATALDSNGNYKNCAEVYADGIYNIGPDHPRYDEGLDNDDDDVIGCENPDLNRYPNLKNLAAATSSPKPAARPQASLPSHVTQPDAIDNQYTYPDCKDVFAAGLANLPKSSKYYHADLDADLDGIGCEVNGDDAWVPAAIKAKYAPATAARAEESAAAEAPQVTVVPEGTPKTGPEGVALAPFALGAVALAGVAGAGVVARRRQA